MKEQIIERQKEQVNVFKERGNSNEQFMSYLFEKQLHIKRRTTKRQRTSTAVGPNIYQKTILLISELYEKNNFCSYLKTNNNFIVNSYMFVMI